MKKENQIKMLESLMILGLYYTVIIIMIKALDHATPEEREKIIELIKKFKTN